jgi:hypothetical protein
LADPALDVPAEAVPADLMFSGNGMVGTSSVFDTPAANGYDWSIGFSCRL